MTWTRRDLVAVLRDEQVRSISRRYFVSNGFDGTLTSIGVAMGALLSGVSAGRTTFLIGLGAAVGLGTSGVWSVWEIERAEKRAEIRRLERAMLTDLDDTRIERRQRGARAINAVASGVGPIIGVLVPMTPFLLEGVVLTMVEATALAVCLGVGLLFVFGAYMGSIADITWYVAGIRMGLAGLVVAAINFLLPGGGP
ncbi:MAG: VIT1/CCC1 transporter family protein [Haloferacaceae archaeon]